MCGIAGLSGKRVKLGGVTSMTAAIRHRGPDNDATWISDCRSSALGHTRLSIIDLSPAGHQPMLSHDGRFCMSYNGEVYNFPDLKRELLDAYGPINWRGSSDSEVILEGVAREGLDFLRRLNGIFALLLFDVSERRLHALRDPLGIKPLFVAKYDDGIALGSELKCFDQLPGVDRRLRLASIADQLALMYVPEPHTLYQGINKLAPGVLYSFETGVPTGERPLFDDLVGLPDQNEMRSDANWTAAFSEAFSTAVGRQIIADVPVGLMLSGGLDSSAVAHELHTQGADVREAFTISVSSRDCSLDGQADDLTYARRVADKYGIRLNVIEAKPEFVTDIDRMIPFFEDGYSDPAAINTFLISEAARDMGIKVLLTGQGADEFLCGYRRYMVAPALMRLPEAAAPLARALKTIMPANVRGKSNSLVRRANRLLSVAGQPKADRLLGLFSWASSETVRAMLADPGTMQPLEDLRRSLERPEGASLVNRMSHTDIRYDLLALNLTYCDRMSMAAGIEARVPFLDFDLVRLMSRIPETMKLRGRETKYVLRQAMVGKLSNEVIYREKSGFSLPLRAWLSKGEIGLEHYFDPTFLQRQGLFDPEYWSTMIAAFRGGREDIVYPVFSFYCLQKLLDRRGSQLAV